MKIQHNLEAFKNKTKVEFKPKFVEHYKSLTDWEEFKKYSLAFLQRSIRVNTLKADVTDIKEKLSKEWHLQPIPWCKEGFWIKHKGEGKDERRDIGNLIEHALGYIYVQEAASMIPPIVLDPQPGELILDMCAAPGSKTTQIAQYMKNKGMLIANDVTHQRLQSLGINVQRCGITNTVITQMDALWFKDMQFDRILLDAPCSGTGTIRKSLKTLRMWNPNGIKRLAGMQRRLIEKAFSLLKPGGTLVYSTCSNEPEENEAVVSHLLQKFPDAVVESFKLDIKHGDAITEFDGNKYHPDVKHCLRIWPQENDTEGFFVAKIKKKNYSKLSNVHSVSQSNSLFASKSSGSTTSTVVSSGILS
jgi:tRNA (cytosine49-C5)-methyltransferase